jgi:hypothetical protein
MELKTNMIQFALSVTVANADPRKLKVNLMPLRHRISFLGARAVVRELAASR